MLKEYNLRAEPQRLNSSGRALSSASPGFRRSANSARCSGRISFSTQSAPRDLTVPRTNRRASNRRHPRQPFCDVAQSVRKARNRRRPRSRRCTERRIRLGPIRRRRARTRGAISVVKAAAGHGVRSTIKELPSAVGTAKRRGLTGIMDGSSSFSAGGGKSACRPRLLAQPPSPRGPGRRPRRRRPRSPVPWPDGLAPRKLVNVAPGGTVIALLL